MPRKLPDPFTLVIFGASGDLTRRKLAPAVFGLFCDGLLPEDFRLVGWARSSVETDVFREDLRKSTRAARGKAEWDESQWAAFVERVSYHTGGYDAEGLQELPDVLKQNSATGEVGNVLYDLATPPVVFASIAEGLRAVGLVQPPGAEHWSRIIIEKPFGSDLESARELNRRVRGAFGESQIFRIDHYLGKETVQNLLVLRFANAIFEPVWNQKYVDHVQITVSETMSVAGRGGYYDRAGAIRDIVQNHMMHLLCLVAMEPPVALEAGAVRDEKVKLLRALRPMQPECVSDDVVRAQYAACEAAGEPVKGYLEEEGVAVDSRTETFVALKTWVDNWRWAGVPFYLRTGKAMPARLTDISVHFKRVPKVLFNLDREKPLEHNKLGIRIQPNEGISLQFQVKAPGHESEIRPYQMDFGYVEAFGGKPHDAYERLLVDAALGDPTLFIRDDEVEAAWQFVNPILEACAGEANRLPQYAAGTWGPAEADRMIEADGRRWDIMKRPLPKTKRK